MTEDILNKKGSFTPVIIVMFVTLILAGLWEKVPQIKNSIHAIFDPTAGVLLNWNLNWGMAILVLIITLITTLVQKYATDQKKLKELKKEQKEMQDEMKKVREHPERLMELQKKQMSMMGDQMKLGMRGIVYTGIPFLLLFRWFTDYFATAGNPKIFGMGWIWFYLLGAIIFGSILRKITDTV